MIFIWLSHLILLLLVIWYNKVKKECEIITAQGIKM